MKLSLLGVVAVLVLAQGAQAKISERIRGVNEAKSTIRIVRPDVEYTRPEGESFQTCYIFPTFVALELDSGQKGADEIVLRALKKSDDPKRVCETKYPEKEVRLPEYNDQYALGERDGVFFTESADGFGNLYNVMAYDSTTGKLLYDASASLGENYEVKTVKSTLSLEYSHLLKASCSIATDKACWEKIISENQIPNAKDVTAPDCSDVYKHLKKLNDPQYAPEKVTVQIFAKVRIEDIRNPKMTYLKSKTSCALEP